MKSHGVVAIIKKDDKYLLVKDSRALMFGFWMPPGGGMNKNDPDEETAVAREVAEETNLKVKPVKKLWTTKADTKVKTVTFWLAELIGGDINLDKNEVSDFKWVAPEAALELKLYPGTKKFFEKVKQGEIKI